MNSTANQTVQHTPGKWKVEPYLTPDRDDDPMMVYQVKAGNLQQRYDNCPMDDEYEYDQEKLASIHAENEANARLIAAAPDLLAALKTLVASLDWEAKRSGTTYHGYEEAVSAIAKTELKGANP